MRFELEKTWDTKRRLEYWEKRSGFHKGNGRGKTRWTENDVIEFCKRNNIPFTASGGKITGLSAEFTATFKKAEDGNWEKR